MSRGLIQPVLDFLTPQKRVLLAFSGGKDSLACLCALTAAGLEVQPCYYALVPGLSWVEEYLEYIHRRFGVHVLRLQHPQTYHWLRTYTFQPPHRKTTIELLQPPTFSFPHINRGVRRTMEMRDPSRSTKDGGTDWAGAWTCMGTRYVDSYHRRLTFQRKGWKREDNLSCSPIHDYSKEDVLDTLKHHKVKVSKDYLMFGRSFDGIDYRFLKVVKEDYPADYQRILELVPMAGVELLRVEWAVKHGLAKIR